MIEALNKINNLELLTKSDMVNVIFSLKKKFNLEGYSIRLLNNNLYLYDKYWHFFYFDYNANIRAMKSILSLIDNGYIKVNKNSIYLINMYFAKDLLKSYGISFTDKNKTRMNLTCNSPIMFMNKNKYRLIYDSKMDYIALNNSIKKALNESNLINMINLGSPLSCDIINTLILISLLKVKTSNIFNLVENSNKKIKKLSK